MYIQVWHQPQQDELRHRQMPPVSKKTTARPTTDTIPRQHRHQQHRHQQQQQQQQQQAVPSPLKPQLHSRKCHHTYNATRHLPLAVWIRSARVKDSAVVYEIVLCYEHNRACTISRTWEDFQKLKSGLGNWRNAPTFCSPKDIDSLQRYLCEAISKKGREVAMEFFLRRRMDDC